MSSTNSTPSQSTPPSSTQSTRSSSPASGKASKLSADPLTDALSKLAIKSQGTSNPKLDENHNDKVVEELENLEQKAEGSSSAPVTPKNETRGSSTASTGSTSVSRASLKSDSGDKDVVGNGKSHAKSSIAPPSRKHTSSLSGLKRTRGQEDSLGKGNPPQKKTKTGERPILPIGTKRMEIGTGKKETGKKDKE